MQKMFSKPSWMSITVFLIAGFQLTEQDSFLNKLNIAERKVSLRRYYAPLTLTELKQKHVSKRLFKRHKKYKMGRSNSLGKAKSVLTKVGGVIKKTGIKAKNFIVKHFGKVKEVFKKVKEKLSKAVRRAKDVFKKCKGVKYVLFIKKSALAVWNNMPEVIKDKIFDKIVDASIGDLDDLEELSIEDFDPDELGDDDDLAELLGDDYAELAKELGLDYDNELEAEVEDLDENDKKVIKKTSAGKELKDVEVKAKQDSNSCCCVTVEGKDEGSHAVPDEALGSAAVSDEDENIGLDVEMKDFTEESLDEEELDLSDLDDMEFDDLGGFEFEKRSLEVTKRTACPCASSSLARREYVRGLQIRKQKNKNALPALTSSLPGYLIEEFLKRVNIETERPICKEGNTNRCLNLSVVRFGALAALLSTKVLCPLCTMKIMKFDKSNDNPFVKGWNFYLQGTEDLSVFLSEAFKTYDGQADLFDGHNNRWSIVESAKGFLWKFRTHL